MDKSFDKDQDKMEKCCKPRKINSPCGGAGGGIYFFSMVGVAVYYIQQVDGFWPIVLAILKAIVWPAFLMYHVFQALHL